MGPRHGRFAMSQTPLPDCCDLLRRMEYRERRSILEAWKKPTSLIWPIRLFRFPIQSRRSIFGPFHLATTVDAFPMVERQRQCLIGVRTLDWTKGWIARSSGSEGQPNTIWSTSSPYDRILRQPRSDET